MPGLIWLCLLLIISFHEGVADAEEFVYNGFSGSNLHLDGTASITEDGVLCLTTSSTYIQGHGFHPEALPFVDSHGVAMSFSATFVFSITPSDSGTSGDGMAFVISLAPLSSHSWTVGQYLGLGNQDYDPSLPQANRFFAIELDTVANTDFGDMDNNHVGIDLNNLTSAGSLTAGYYSVNDEKDFNPLKLSSGNPMQVWVDYYDMQLDVRLVPVPMYKPTSPFLSYYPVDLAKVLKNNTKSKAGVPTPTTAYVGFSAATGGLNGAHQILGWSFNMFGPAKPLNLSLLPFKRVQDSSRQEAHDKKKVVKWLPATLSSLAILLAVITTCLLLRWWWCKIRSSKRNEDWEAELGPRRFAYKDLRRVTNGFHDKQLLGKGGFGQVYGGVLASSTMRMAVKRVSAESKQGLAEFTAEIIILGRIRHRNLVRLVGYCRHKNELLLVYEYMPNGSLDSYLHAQTRHAMLSWPQRLHIIKGVASGLLYLHEDWEQVIIHRDIKASNVLLDGEMNGRLGDFGLARLHDHGVDAHTTHVAGTRGYLAPELTRFGKATKATDMFAFGAFVLEVACGRRPVGFNARGELLVLFQWVRDTWASGSCSIVDTIDPRLDDYVADEAELVLKLGLLCSHPLPVARPSIRLVMRYLDGDLPLPEFSPGYLSITDVDQVLDEVPPSVANTITGLSGGR